MTPSTDGPDAARATPQPVTTPPSTAGMASKQGETLPPGTLPFSGPKHGLPPEFGRYRVQKLLGGGGIGAVYLVVNTELEREEALKVPHFEGADDPQVRERFLREAKAAAGLDHPNLCPVYDVGVREGVYYLTMRYLQGKLLSEYGGTAQPPAEAMEIVVKLARALATAHAKGVIHRDLKPNNVMMCDDVGPVVMDFGLAKQTDRQDKALTQMGTTLGTPAYMPPEQVRGELDRMGPASDVYSLGVILFQLLTGRLPFEGRTAAEVYGKILHVEAPSPSSLRPGLPAALDVICAKALAKTPEGRYASMKEFAAALTDQPKAAVAVGKRGNGRPRRMMPVLALVLLMLGGLGVAGTYLWMMSANAPSPNTPLALAQPPSAPPTNPVEPSVEPAPVPETIPVEASVKPTPPPENKPVEAAIKPKPAPAANPVDKVVKPAPMPETVHVETAVKPAPVPARSSPKLQQQTEPSREARRRPGPPTSKFLPTPKAKPVENDEPPSDDVVTNSIGMKLKPIKSGKFMMGSPDSDKNAQEDEKPQHEVQITHPFYMGVYAVTKGQFAKFVNDTNYQTDAERAGDAGNWRSPVLSNIKRAEDEDPVVYVSWNDAVKFCEWLSQEEKTSYGLPTEAQWEYACRAGTTTVYSFGDDPEMLDDYARYKNNSVFHMPVGSRRSNPWGLFDMHGNVWEWCADHYDDRYYQNSPKKDPQNILRSGVRVCRGGSWKDKAVNCRAAYRNRVAPGYHYNDMGFRICLRPD